MLDKTKTAMGARALRSMIEQPLINKEDILKRQAGIEECNNRAIDREEIREYLNPVYDLERIMTKISCKSCKPTWFDCIPQFAWNASIYKEAYRHNGKWSFRRMFCKI